MSAKATALVVVSHSGLVARGVVEIAAQMAPDVVLLAAGGTQDGRIGTSFDAVEAALAQALGTDGVEAVVLTADLGSAVMTAESVVDLADGNVRLAEGPLVEGTVAAAVRAQLGAGAEDVAAAAAGEGADGAAAGGMTVAEPSGEDAADAGDAADAADAGTITKTLTLVNPQGLHARPAALLARTAGGFDATVTIDGADAASIIAVMGLGAGQGAEVTVSTSGPQAAEAMEAVEHAITSGLGDL